ncbi:MAG: CPBP family intramembrane metalloprotease [Armatimonadetes bacterium]|nr:CPBP family intramembrane metalloprotease [Armatimonadota bacterium]MDW8120898.1 CPBP family intramembrane glutamic endopeptidase [Armatimonadota bacterium]
MTCGLLLTASEYLSPFHPFDQLRHWCLWSFLCGFLVPVGLIGSLSGSWRGWGLSLGDWRFGFLASFILWLIMIPFVFWARNQPSFQDYYRPLYFLASKAPLTYLFLMALYMWGWEFLFRGFLLFGLLPFSRLLAIVYPTLLFAAAHWGKPFPEFLGSFVAGLVLALVCERANSFLPAFVTHLVVYITFISLVS